LRLDKALVERRIFESRNKALEAIKAGEVLVDGEVATKPSQKISLDSQISTKGLKKYVSRSAWKLKLYFNEYPLYLDGRVALDIGSSTGGFTQVLLESGVKSVDCVDVGKEQLHPKIRLEDRVRLFEQRDIRGFDDGRRYDLIVSDVSFISLSKILSDIERLTESEADIILLFKPQFEVGKDAKRDSRGVVQDQNAIQKARESFEKRVKEFGWELLVNTPSLQKGKEGNLEYIYHFKKGKLESKK
jgi:23S rRNA (cytidine1920-2'-O)/16S rRNA (cytidine1409-2'-O)-methyltransferase